MRYGVYKDIGDWRTIERTIELRNRLYEQQFIAAKIQNVDWILRRINYKVFLLKVDITPTIYRTIVYS